MANTQNIRSLTDDVEDDFRFDIRGDIYSMRYPTMEEVEKLQELAGKAEKKNDSEASLDNEVFEYLYSFISPVNEGGLSIKERIKKENVKVMKNFFVMIQEEFNSVG